MSLADRAITSNLDRASKLWKTLRFLQHSFVVGTLALLAVLLIGVALDGGWLGRTMATALMVCAGFACLFAWMLAALVVTVTPPERTSLAEAIEAVDAPLLDRLNTLVHLEETGRSEKLPSFAERIKSQAVEVLRRCPPPAPFSPRPIYRKAGLFLATALVTVWFHARFDPWRTPPELVAQSPPPESPIEIPPPESVTTEEEAIWGEVRISEPGRDLKVNKFETVPLQIEAAASRPIEKVEWFTAVNGGPETAHPLDGQTDPRYVVHRPVLRATDHPLAEWDVLTYYAKATTHDGRTFQSDTYFLEVVPLRHELEKLPGGTDSHGYEMLNELTGMIEEQQEVIRQTHRHREIADGETDKRTRHRQALADRERDLGLSSRHLGAVATGKFGETLSGGLRQRLTAADKSLHQAADALGDAAIDDAQAAERTALADLIAARKALQDAMRKNPHAFADSADPPAGEQAAKTLEKLRSAERETQHALEFVQKTIAQEQQIQKQAGANSRAQASKLAGRQQQLQQSFADFARERPEPFSDLDSERAACEKSMAGAAEQLKSAKQTARQEVDRAVEALRQLADGLGAKVHAQKLAEAHQLREMLDAKARMFEQVERQPEKFSNEPLRHAADQTRAAAERLRELAEQQPTRDDFSQKLRESLGPPNQQRLDGL